MTHLPALLATYGLSRRALARALGLHASTITHWLRQGEARRPAAATLETIRDWLLAQGVPGEVAAGWETCPPPGTAGGEAPATRLTTDDDSEDATMLMRRQPIPQATRRHFGLACDPFARDLESAADVYEFPDLRYVREAMRATAEHGGLLAVVGESGSGKTTILDDLEDWIAREERQIILVRPAVAGMEATESRGQVLRVAHLQEAIIHALDETASLRQSPQGRAEQLRRMLIAARDAGRRVVLGIDEGHAMPQATLRHCKRLLEIKQGFTRLLSIIILGQPELGIRLSPRSPDLREVVQRCEVVTLDPLDDQIEGYLAHKLLPAGRTVADLLAPDALDAIRERLGVVAPRPGAPRPPPSRAYPLAVANLLAAGLNRAALAGAPRVTAAIIQGI